MRRQLHNRLQELVGNIRVFVRVRPMSSMEQVRPGESLGVSFPSAKSLAVYNPQRAATQTFSFDHVYGLESSQADVFEEVSLRAKSSGRAGGRHHGLLLY